MAITVEDLLKSIEGNAKYVGVQEQLERFSPGTPIRKGSDAGGAILPTEGAEVVSFTEKSKMRMHNGEVVIEG